VLVSIHCIVLLYFAHAAFIPVALALLFALVLSSPVEALHRKGLPRSLSSALILSSVVAVAAVAVTLLWAPAQEWLEAAPRTVKMIEQKFRPTADVLHQIDAVTDRAGRLTDGGDSATGSPSRVTLVPVAPGGFLLETRDVMVDLKGRTLASAGPVSGQMRLGNFQAGRLSADLGERKVVLDGGARLKIVQGAVR